MLVNGTKVVDPQFTLLNQLSLLPSSFPEYISSKPYYNAPSQVNELLLEGAELCACNKLTKGLIRFKKAIKQIPSNHPNNLFSAHLHQHAAVTYQKLGNYSKAIENMNRSINIFHESKDYYGVEQAYKVLAQVHGQNGTLRQYQKTNLDMLDKSLQNNNQQLQLRARLALGGIDRTQGNHEGALSHYATAYELQQGQIDYDAVRVEQHEVGFSDQKIGTDNIQQCVAVILHDPVTKKTALAHVDIYTDVSSLTGVIGSFPNSTNLNAYLVGGRDRSPQSKAVSDSNIAKVTSELQKHTNINIKSADIGDKGAPSGIVFDPQTSRLKHAVPGKIHETTNARKLLYNLTPQLNFVFDLTISHEIKGPMLSQQDKEKLVERFIGTPKLPKTGTIEAYNASIIYDPLAKTVEQIRKTDPQIVFKVLEEDMDRKLIQEHVRLGTLNSQLRIQTKHDLTINLQNSLQDSKKSFSQIQQETNIAISKQAALSVMPSEGNAVIISTFDIPSKSIDIPPEVTSSYISRASGIVKTARQAVLRTISKLSNRDIKKEIVENSFNSLSNHTENGQSEAIKKADHIINSLATSKSKPTLVRWQAGDKATQKVRIKAHDFPNTLIANYRIKNNEKKGTTR